MNTWMDVNGEFWVTPNGLDLPRRAGSYCYWKAANMIRPRNGIQSDFGFIYSPVSYESIDPNRNRKSRIRSNGNRLTFAALFLSDVTNSLCEGSKAVYRQKYRFALSAASSRVAVSFDSRILGHLIFSTHVPNAMSEMSRIQLRKIVIYSKALFHFVEQQIADFDLIKKEIKNFNEYVFF